MLRGSFLFYTVRPLLYLICFIGSFKPSFRSGVALIFCGIRLIENRLNQACLNVCETWFEVVVFVVYVAEEIPSAY